MSLSNSSHIQPMVKELKQIDFDGSLPYSGVTEIFAATEFQQNQNYPNPSHPVTNIQFAVTAKELISLKVYDVLGNEVTTLLNEEREPGSYTVQFDASLLSRAVYYYTLRTGNNVATKKMVVLK